MVPSEGERFDSKLLNLYTDIDRDAPWETLSEVRRGQSSWS